ncbi:MAG: protein phosphatase CheZ [Rickettsiales bacterium]
MTTPTPSLEIAQRLTRRFRDICGESGIDFKDPDVAAIEEEFAAIMRDYLYHKNCQIYQEVRKIIERINETRSVVVNAHCMAENPLGRIQDEISAVMKHNERAAERIITGCECIQQRVSKKDGAACAADVSGALAEIMQACDFQDLSGQRLTKVAETLDFVDDTIGGLVRMLAAQIKAERSETDELRNGPQIDAIDQDDIDKLFDMA